MYGLHRNGELERDLVCLKEELNISLKWTTFLLILYNMDIQGVNDGIGIGYQEEFEHVKIKERVFIILETKGINSYVFTIEMMDI